MFFMSSRKHQIRIRFDRIYLVRFKNRKILEFQYTACLRTNIDGTCICLIDRESIFKIELRFFFFKNTAYKNVIIEVQVPNSIQKGN